jgi:hypothetical protein
LGPSAERRDVTGVTIELRFTDAAAERRFLTSVLPAAWERYETSEYWKQGWFWSYGQFAGHDVGPDGGLVRLVFEGDPDALLAAERERWAAFDGLVDWSVERYDEAGFESLLAQQRAAKGSRGGRWAYRYKPLTARLALSVREAFDGSLPAAPEQTAENTHGLGMWSLVHALYVQCGYDWYDETDASLRAMQNRLKSIASYRGADAAREEYRRLLDAWRAHEDELTAWLDDHETGTASI